MGLPQRIHHYTEAEFAALVRGSDKRLELWNGEIYDMSYTSPSHRDIVKNLDKALSAKLKAPCETRMSEPVRPPKTTGLYREPDLVVLCGPRKIETHQGFALTVNPVVVIEVVSPETERFDRNEKLDEYRRIATLREYLIVSQRSAVVNQWTRHGDLWRETVVSGTAAALSLSLSPKVTLAMKEIYRGVSFK